MVVVYSIFYNNIYTQRKLNIYKIELEDTKINIAILYLI